MKKRFSVLFALVLVLSLVGVIPQAPVEANGSQYGTLYMEKDGTSGGVSGQATWFTPGARFDNYAASLNGGKDANDSYGRVWKRVNIPLANITDISFWYHHVSIEQADYSLLPLYKQEGQTYTEDDGYVSPYVILEISNGTDIHSIISQPFARDPDGGWLPAWEQWQITDNAAAAGGHDPTEALWHDECCPGIDDPGTGDHGSAYPVGWEYLTFFQNLYSGYNVVKLMISMGEWALTTEQAAYVDDITVDNMTYAIEPRVFIGSTPYGAIDTAIGKADDYQTINVYPGTFSPAAFPIDVNIDGLTIRSVSGAASTIIDGESNAGVIEITKADVTIGGIGRGLTITNDFSTAPAVTGHETDYGVLIGGGDDALGVKIQDNIFRIKGYGIVLGPGANSTLANKAEILDNTFEVGWAALRTTQVWDGVENFVTNIDILRNVVNAGIDMGFVLESTSQVLFDDNTITGADPALYLTANDGGTVTEFASDFTITNNTFTDCPRGIQIWPGTNSIGGPSTIEDVTITKNTFSGGDEGIRVLQDGTDGDISNIVIKYNHIAGHTTYGVENQFISTAVDAKYNWWGTAAGAYHPATNLGVAGYRGDTVSDNVDYTPWLYLTLPVNGGDTVANIVANQVPAYARSVILSPGWNTFSVPIGLDGQYNTWAELITLTGLDYDIAQRFDLGMQKFVALADGSGYEIAPGESFYIKMNSAGSIPYAYSTQSSPSSRDLQDGWNFIGGGMTTRTEIENCISIATAGDTPGYTHIISPAENDSSWVYLAGDSSAGVFEIGEGYWVLLPINRKLDLFDPTPVTWVP